MAMHLASVLNIALWTTCSLLLGLASATAQGPSEDKAWYGGGANTHWTTDANWFLGIEPDANDEAQFGSGAINYTVTFPLLPFSADITTARLSVGSNTFTFEHDHSSTNYLITEPTTANEAVNRGVMIGIGANESAVLISHLSLLEAVAATLGYFSNSSGTLTLNQNNDLFNLTGGSTTNAELILGRQGSGVLNVSSGADVAVNGSNAGFPAGSVSLGRDSSGQGTVNVSGAGSTLDVNTLLVIGDAGTGTLNVTAGGVVESLTGILGDLAGSTGTATISGAGSRWNVSFLTVGDAGTGTLHVLDGGTIGSITNIGIVDINGASTLNLDDGTIDGDVDNSGLINVTGPSTITGSLDNAVNADTLIDLAEPPGSVGLDVGGSLTNGGTVSIMIDYVEPINDAVLKVAGSLTNSGTMNLIIHDAEPPGVTVVDAAGGIANSGTITIQIDTAEPTHNIVQLGVGQTFTNNATGVVNLNGPADAGGGETIESKHVIAGSVVNSGQMNVRTNAQVTGSLTTAVDAETIVEPASPCCGMTLEVRGSVSNSGTFTVRNPIAAGAAAGGGGGSSSHADVVLVAEGGVTNSGTFTMQIDYGEPCCNVELQLGAGQTLTNTATGVVNLNGPTDAGGAQVIDSKHIITGSVINSGQMNVRGNTQIEGSLTVAVDAETVVNPGEPCCNMVFEVAGSVANSGTFTMQIDNAEPTHNIVQLGAGQTFTNNAGGVVRGTGVIEADVVNHGQLQPGQSPGVLTIAGDYTQASDGRLVVDVAGTTAGSEYDQLAVGGAIALDGVVEVIFGEGFAPQVGNRFEIITTAEPPGGKFAGASLPGLPEGMDWGIHYDANLVSLAIGVPGDYNGNGTVDAADYTAWRDTLGQTGVFLAADGNGNDEIDAGDYQFWRDHFGETAGGPGGASVHLAPDDSPEANYAVPEPSTWLLLVVGVGVTCRFTRRE